MATSTKAIKLAAELADELRKRVSDYAVITEGFDSNGWPTIFLGNATPATTEDVVFIRVRPREWDLATDVLGTAQRVYTPSVIQIAVEGPSSGLGLARYVSIAHFWAIVNTCAKRGCRIEYWEEANGDDPTIDTFTDGDMLASQEPDLDWPLLSSQ